MEPCEELARLTFLKGLLDSPKMLFLQACQFLQGDDIIVAIAQSLWSSAGNNRAAAKGFPVIVTSYEIVMADLKFLQQFGWKYIIVDEGHRLKNWNCKLLRELRSLEAGNKMILSGM